VFDVGAMYAAFVAYVQSSFLKCARDGAH
jgi:hypothetical protein